MGTCFQALRVGGCMAYLAVCESEPCCTVLQVSIRKRCVFDTQIAKGRIRSPSTGTGMRWACRENRAIAMLVGCLPFGTCTARWYSRVTGAIGYLTLAVIRR